MRKRFEAAGTPPAKNRVPTQTDMVDFLNGWISIGLVKLSVTISEVDF